MTEENAQRLVARWAEDEDVVHFSEIQTGLVAFLKELVSADVAVDLAEGPSRGEESPRKDLILVGNDGVLRLSVSELKSGSLIAGKLIALGDSHVSVEVTERYNRDDGSIRRQWRFNWEGRYSLNIDHEIHTDVDDEMTGALKLAKALGWPAP